MYNKLTQVVGVNNIIFQKFSVNITRIYNHNIRTGYSTKCYNGQLQLSTLNTQPLFILIKNI